jgi:hypothetical protein
VRKTFLVAGLSAISLFIASLAMAHTPLCSCYDNGDGTITCEGGFSDGSSAAGVTIRVVDVSGKVLVEGKMNENSEFSCKKPDGPYKMQFDAGPGHLVEVKGDDIVE